MTRETKPFDAAIHVDTLEEELALLKDAYASGNETVVGNALQLVLRAREMREAP